MLVAVGNPLVDVHFIHVGCVGIWCLANFIQIAMIARFHAKKSGLLLTQHKEKKTSD